MNSEPLVSAIIPAFNGGPFLADAVVSILAQNHVPLEVIVVDDGSTDDTAAQAARLGGRVRYFYQPNRGGPAARNQGLRLARGELVAFLDVDDLWTPDKLALQLALLHAHPQVDIVLGHTQLMQLRRDGEGQETFMPSGAPRLAMSMGAALFRHEIFSRTGPFDETQRYCEDLDWFMRARENGDHLLVHPEITLYYRRHDRNMTNDVGVNNRYLMKMLRDSLTRRRAEGGAAVSLPPLAPDPAETEHD